MESALYEIGNIIIIIKIYLSNHQYDIICINETWLDDKINTYEVSLDGYDLVRKDRKRTGGGVAMYIRNSISYKIGEDIMPDGLETITVEIKNLELNLFFLTRGTSLPICL